VKEAAGYVLCRRTLTAHRFSSGQTGASGNGFVRDQKQKKIGGIAMRISFAVAVATLATATAAAFPAAAVAAPASNTFAVRGVETAFTSTSATFSGTGTGNAGDRAAWFVSITRTRFASGLSTITGGTFTMRTVSPNWTTDWVAGTVAGGSVQKTSGFTGCTNEKFALTVSLTDVATKTTAGGTGTFIGELTHHRTSIFGTCVIYSATVTGVVTLSY
jgi:hypothetical protein